MKTIELATTGRRTTPLAFGTGLTGGAAARLFDAAYDAGIRHFDVAPSYGNGQTEPVLGEFLQRHGNDVTVTTKYGILPRQRSLLRYATRRLSPALRPFHLDALVRGKAPPPHGKPRFEPNDMRQSLDRSLKRLRRDRVDLFLIHEPLVTDLANPKLLDTLHENVAAGKIGAFGMGGTAETMPAIYANCRGFCDVVQYDWSILQAANQYPDSFHIHYRTFSKDSRFLADSLAQQDLLKPWSDQVGADLGDSDVLSALMLKGALLLYPSSIVLFSSQKVEHIEANVRIADNEGLADGATRLTQLLAGVAPRLAS